jgi:hypothetical protein
MAGLETWHTGKVQEADTKLLLRLPAQLFVSGGGAAIPSAASSQRQATVFGARAHQHFAPPTGGPAGHSRLHYMANDPTHSKDPQPWVRDG